MADDSAPRIHRSLFFSTLSAGSAGLMLVLIAYATNTLTLEDFGRLMIALALATIGESLMDFGLHQVTIRAIAQDRASAARVLANSLPLKLLPALLMFAALTGYAWWRYQGPDALSLRLTCTLMLGSAILRSYLLTVRGVLLGLERFATESILQVADRVLLLVAGSLALYLGYGIVGVGVAFIAARLIALSAALLVARAHVGSLSLSFDWDAWRDLQSRAIPLGAFIIVLNVYSYVDVLILKELTTEAETGLYGVAYRFYEGLTYGTGVLSAVLLPRLSSFWTTNRAAHQHWARVSIGASAALAVVIGALACVIATPLLQVVNGPEYGAAALALQILAAGLPFVYVIWILHAVAISTDASGLLLRATIAGVVLNLGLNILFIPIWQRNGAAAATVIAEACVMLILLWGLRRVWLPASTGRA
jgi:O-antigen/teichoic acid export membrane protein